MILGSPIGTEAFVVRVSQRAAEAGRQSRRAGQGPRGAASQGAQAG